MKISELKEEHPLIYESAQKQRTIKGLDHIAEAIDWGATKEGLRFWATVCDGDFTKAYEICPHLKPSK